MKAVFVALLAVVMGGLSTEAGAAHFVNPTWNGYALDWCREFGMNCGKPAADLYCQKRGFPKSVSFVEKRRVNYETMTVGQNSVCDPRDHQCDTFYSIDCQETVVTFVQPKYNGYRLDWCKDFENNCGAPAAAEYCQKAGYPQLVSFSFQAQLNVPTMTVNSNAVCNPQFHRCDSFGYVQCKK